MKTLRNVAKEIKDFSKLSPQKTVSACIMTNGKFPQQDRVLVGKTDFAGKGARTFFEATLPTIIDEKSKGHVDSGATLVTVAITPGAEEGILPKLTTAHLGDSCAALVVGLKKSDETLEFSSNLLTKPHDFDHPSVIKHLSEAGIDLDSIEEDSHGEKRLMGLAMGAAIGHQNKPLLRVPEIIEHDLNDLKYLPQYSGGEIIYLKLVVASDGVPLDGLCGREILFDEDGKLNLITRKELLPIAPFSREIAEAHEKGVSNTSEFLAFEAIERGSTDNIAVSIVNLDLISKIKKPDDPSAVIVISDGNGKSGHLVSDAVTSEIFKMAKMEAIHGMEEATPTPSTEFEVGDEKAEKLSAEEIAAAMSERS